MWGKFLTRHLTRVLGFALNDAVARGVSADHTVIQGLEDTRESLPLPLEQVRPAWLDTLDADRWQSAVEALDNYILPMLGQTDLRRYNTRRLRAYKDELAQRGCSEAVFRMYLAMLNNLREFATEQDLWSLPEKICRFSALLRHVGVSGYATVSSCNSKE